MENKKLKQNTVLIVLILLLGLVVIGATYAYLTLTASVNRGVYNITSSCFLVDYTDNTQTITGTMFPSINHTKGLSGSVALKINNNCDTLGTGRIYVHINSGTSNKFGTIAAAHCENSTTLETLADYDTSSECTTGGGSWVSNGTVLKYAIFDNSAGTGTPVAVGYFDGNYIGQDMPLYEGFQINKVQKTFYLFFWLDGHITDNTYTNLLFDGYIEARATQVEDIVPEMYQQVEYIHFSGTQYINTGVSPSMYNGNYGIEIDEKHAANSSNMYIFGTAAAKSNANSRANIRIDANGVTANAYVNKSDNSGALGLTATSKLVVNKINTIKFFVNSTNHTREFQVNDYTVSDNTTSFISLSTVTFRIGGYNTTASYVGDIYGLRISGNGTLVRNLIPCYRKSDNVVGFYDTITGGFLTSSGSGSLTIPN